MYKYISLGCISCFLLLAPATAQRGSARYELTFTSTWSVATHPTQFPPNAHYSPLIGATHDAGVTFWSPGSLATPGIENMAETGSTTALRGEVITAINAGTADQVLNGSGMGSPASQIFRFEVDASHSLLTLVSMLAPSPDWYVGVRGLDLMPNGVWADELSVDLTVWDAGTDNGTTYTSPNANSNPPQPIQTVTQSMGPFQGASLVVGTFRLTRLASGLVYGCDVNPVGSMQFGGDPTLGGTVTMTISDPTGLMPTPAQTLLLLSRSPWPGFPCGISIPGFGMDPTMAGEFLIGTVFRAFFGVDWNGSGVDISIPIPASTGLIGSKFYFQGALVNGLRVGLADGVELLIGQ